MSEPLGFFYSAQDDELYDYKMINIEDLNLPLLLPKVLHAAEELTDTHGLGQCGKCISCNTDCPLRQIMDAGQIVIEAMRETLRR